MSGSPFDPVMIQIDSSNWPIVPKERTIMTPAISEPTLTFPLKGAPISQICDVTPAIARWFLDFNSDNRRIRKAYVKKYAGLMTAGEWELTNDAICVTGERYLLNGQHRLLAVVESGCTVRLLVLWNCPAGSFEKMDRPLSRSAADALGLRGHLMGHVLAAGIQAYSQFTARQWSRQALLEPSQVIALLEAHPGIEGSVRIVQYHPVTTPGNTVAMHYVFKQIDQELADDFFEKLGSGAGMVSHHPVLKLREKLLSRGRGMQLSRKVECAYIIKSWNYLRAGKPCLMLRFKDEEEFPSPR